MIVSLQSWATATQSARKRVLTMPGMCAADQQRGSSRMLTNGFQCAARSPWLQSGCITGAFRGLGWGRHFKDNHFQSTL